MSNYTKTTDFEAKDSLPSGDSGKIIKGAEFETEFDAISTAIATKADADGATLTGTTSFETLSDGTISVTAFVDEDDMVSDSATLVPTQQSVKAYVDSQVTAQDLDFQADTGGALSIDLDSETLTFTGGTGIDTSGSGNAVTFAIDSTVATLTGTQTLTNKTLTSPDVNTPDIDGGTIDGATIATSDITVGTGKTLDVSSGTLTLADNQISGDKVEGGTIASTTITSLASTTVDTTNVEVTNIKAKDGTSAGSIADTTGVVTLASSVLTTTDINGGTIDGATIGGTTAAAGSFTTVSATGNITVDGTVDGRDVATDGTKLDGIEAGADVTDTTNVTAAGALMDSELTDITAVKALDQGVATTDSPTFAGLTTTADVSFGDNDKAIFGAGSDLQIYSDGTNSVIKESGAGSLVFEATNINLKDATATDFTARFITGGDVRLYYDGDQKIATTSTGIDVTGTVTADGLTVDGDSISFNTTAGDLDINPLGGGSVEIESSGTLGVKVAGTSGFLVTDASDNNIFKAALSGDISFYEDTGTTAKLFWDASAESLGIGTSSPSEALEVTGNIQLSAGADRSIIGPDFRSLNIFANPNSSDEGIKFSTDGGTTTEVFIQDGGNVGIGTSSPAAALTVMPESGNFSATYNSYDGVGLFLRGNGTAGNGNYGPALVFGSADSDGLNQENKHSAISLVQTGSDANQTGLAFWVHSSDSSTANLEEAMRIDSSGHLLVGTTDSGIYDDATDEAGHNLLANGQYYNSAVSEINMILNKQNSDGDIVQFRKDGTTVGSIGTVASRFFIGNDDTFITFKGSTDTIYPASSSGGGRDAAIDLGDSGTRFKDLYLSGKVHLKYPGNSYYAKVEVDSSTNLILGAGPNGAERARIDSSGNLLVGKSSSSITTAGTTITGSSLAQSVSDTSTNLATNGGAVLNLCNTSATNGNFSNIGGYNSNGLVVSQMNFINVNHTSRTGAITLSTHNGTSLNEAMRIDSNGFLNIGVSTAISASTNTSDGFTFAPSGGYAWLSVSDTGGIYVQRQNDNSVFSFYRGSSNVGSISVTSSATAYNTSSDQRLKENIVDAPSASDDIDAIQVRSFDWKATGSHQKYGMVAQELQSVAPEAVTGDADSDDMMGVDYSKLVPMLIKEIQSLRARVAELENS